MPDPSLGKEAQTLLEEANSFYEEGYYSWAFEKYLKLWEAYEYAFDNNSLKKIIKCSSTLPAKNFHSSLSCLNSLLNWHLDALQEEDLKFIKKIFDGRKLDFSEKYRQSAVAKLLREANLLAEEGHCAEALDIYMKIWKEYKFYFDNGILNKIFYLAFELSKEFLKKHTQALNSLLMANPHFLADPKIKRIMERASGETDFEKQKKEHSDEEKVIKEPDVQKEEKEIKSEKGSHLDEHKIQFPEERVGLSRPHREVKYDGYSYSLLLAKLYRKEKDKDNEIAQWERLFSRIKQLSAKVRNIILENLTNLYLELPQDKLEVRHISFLCNCLQSRQAEQSFQEKIENKIEMKIHSCPTLDEKIGLADEVWNWCDKNNKSMTILYADLLHERNQKRKEEIEVVEKAVSWAQEITLKVYQVDLYNFNEMLEEAVKVVEDLNAKYPEDKDILRKYREVHCEFSRKLVGEGKGFILPYEE